MILAYPHAAVAHDAQMFYAGQVAWSWNGAEVVSTAIDLCQDAALECQISDGVPLECELAQEPTLDVRC